MPLPFVWTAVQFSSTRERSLNDALCEVLTSSQDIASAKIATLALLERLSFTENNKMYSSVSKMFYYNSGNGRFQSKPQVASSIVWHTTSFTHLDGHPSASIGHLCGTEEPNPAHIRSAQAYAPAYSNSRATEQLNSPHPFSLKAELFRVRDKLSQSLVNEILLKDEIKQLKRKLAKWEGNY